MKTQQQLNQSERDSLPEFDYDQEEGISLAATPRAEGKFVALLITIILLFLAAVILLTLFIASHLEETPKIHIEYLEDSYSPSARGEQKMKLDKETVSSPLMDAMIKEIKRTASSPQSLVDIQLTNGAHRSYQNIMRQLQSDTCHAALEKFSSRKICKDSNLTYQQYLDAVDYLQLTTFPISNVYNDFIEMSKREKDYFEDKYSLSTFLKETSICVVMALTHQGLQNGNYYYALKSLLHQQYWNFKVVVINSPEMGMLEDVNKLISQFPFINVTLIDKIGAKQTTGTSYLIRGAIHKYCKQSDLTILLRDTGELIGRQVLKVINKVYNQQYQPVVLFTNYLLQSAKPIKPKSDPFKYQVQIFPSSLANPRSEAYKTKYLKIYKTEHLLKVEERYFRLAEGWTNGLFEASLEFAMLQLGCVRYYLLEEIFYKATKHDMENALQVLQARAKPKLQCFQGTPLITPIKNQQDSNPPSKNDKQIHFLEMDQIRNLTNEEIILLKAAFRQVHATRASFYSKIHLKDPKTVNQSAIDLASITQASGITLKHVKDIAEELHIGVRPMLYLDELRKQQNTQIPLQPHQPKKITNNDAPRLSDAKPSPFLPDETQFCVFLFTKNNYNKLSFLYTIQSIITQIYSKFRLVILDNKSNDLTAEVIKYHLSLISPNQQQLVTFKQASRSLRRSELLHHAISKYTLPNEVVIVMESGEEFIQNNIFNHLNDHYIKTQALAAYSNAIYLQNDVIHVGPAMPPPSQVIQEKTFRKEPIYFQKLRSFKALLFSKIEQRDFRESNGEWLKEKEDQVLAWIIQQQACGNIAYLNRILVRLPQKPISTIAPSPIGFKYACVQPSKLQTAP